MANSGSEPLPLSAPPEEESTVMVVHDPGVVHPVESGSSRTEAERKRQREYQSKSLRKKKEGKEAAANELTVLRNERTLIAQTLISALTDVEKPSSTEPFNLLTVAQVVTGKLVLFRSAGPSITGAHDALAMSPQSSPCQHHLLPCHSPLTSSMPSSISCHVRPRIIASTACGTWPSAWQLAHHRAHRSDRASEDHQ